MKYEITNAFGAVSNDEIDNPNNVSIIKTSPPKTQIGGDVIINELSIITRQGVRISLLDSFAGFNIDENVFSAFIIGSVTINDIGGALEKWEIEGGERIALKFSMPATNEIIVWREDLIITKIGKYEVDNTNLTRRYTLYFTSKSFVDSTKKLIFKAK